MEHVPDESSARGAEAPVSARPVRLREDFDAAQQLAQVGSWQWDIASNVVLWSEEQCRIFGEDPATYVPSFEGYLSHFPVEERAALIAITQRTLEGQGDFYIEHALTRPDRTVRWVAERGRMVRGPDGAPQKFLGTNQDITERKEHEAELAAHRRDSDLQAALLRSIVENIPVGVFVKHIHDDFRVTLWNKAAERIFDVPREAILGKTVHDLWPKAQADLYLEADRRVAERNVAVVIPEEVADTAGRGTVLVRTVKLPLQVDPRRAPEYLLCLSDDITDARRMTRELEAAKELAEKANRTKSEFLASMSHEIRTPMNGVIGMAQLMMATPLSAEQASMMATLKESGEILLALIDDILDYSKIEAGLMEIETQAFAVEKAVGEIADLLRPRAHEKGLALVVRCDAPLSLRAMGDPRRFRQVLLNLIGNAIKFTKTGRIVVTARMHEGGVRTSVSDTGIGIPDEARSRLFEMFSQADASTTRRYGGTGLGLAISRRLMGLMGGRLDYESKAGEGSTFDVDLPACAPPAVVSVTASDGAPTGASTPTPAMKGLRVLLVEDNLVNQLVGRKMLLMLGCEVDLARDGVECVSMVEPGRYDAVFMDVHMPEMDGLEATRRIREREGLVLPLGRRLPIIAVSASAMQSDRDSATAAGMDRFLTKPLLIEELTHALSEVRDSSRRLA